ncbi:MAG: hypothetical protein H8E72_00755 [Candidatus Marinimicrobia bacterium]|nr:hypothetical protein [Candidatus Neomarinimicrobiota bacterium]
MNHKSEFIQAVHHKIRRKKQQRFMGMSAVITSVVIVFVFYSSFTAKPSHSEEFWTFNDSAGVEYYEWEYLGKLTDDEILIYLMDVNDSDEIIDMADNSDELLLAIQSIKWEK